MIWNIKQPKDGVYAVVRCIQFFARIFGAWPFYIGNQSVGGIKRISMTIISEAFWYIWSTILIILSVYYIYDLIMIVQVQATFLYKRVSNKVVAINRIVGLLILIFSICMDMWNRKRIRNIIAKFNEFDKEVRLA